MNRELPDGYFVRKVGNFSLYPDGDSRQFNTVGRLPADLFSGSLATVDNTLSWWYIPSLDNDEILLSAALLFSAYQRPDFGTMRLVIFPSKYIMKRLKMSNTPEKGRTAFKNKQSKHFDSENMDLNAISWTAKQIGLAKVERHTQVIVKSIKSKQIIDFFRAHKEDISIQDIATWLRAKIV